MYIHIKRRDKNRQCNNIVIACNSQLSFCPTNCHKMKATADLMTVQGFILEGAWLLIVTLQELSHCDS
jgi:hypothetical protein